MRYAIASGILCCFLLGAGTSQAAADVTKATFSKVTFSDGTTGTITAGSKITNKSQFTVCDYFSDAYGAYLGMFQSADFATTDPAALEDFCLSHFAERQ